MALEDDLPVLSRYLTTYSEQYFEYKYLPSESILASILEEKLAFLNSFADEEELKMFLYLKDLPADFELTDENLYRDKDKERLNGFIQEYDLCLDALRPAPTFTTLSGYVPVDKQALGNLSDWELEIIRVPTVLDSALAPINININIVWYDGKIEELELTAEYVGEIVGMPGYQPSCELFPNRYPDMANTIRKLEFYDKGSDIPLNPGYKFTGFSFEQNDTQGNKTTSLSPNGWKYYYFLDLSIILSTYPQAAGIYFDSHYVVGTTITYYAQWQPVE